MDAASRMIRRPPGRCRLDAIEAQITQFERIDKRVDHADRVLVVDPVFKTLGQQRRLTSMRTLACRCIAVHRF